ncbi:MAG: hypothetical protein QOH05_4574, partial [Acetobacteraceae bacterium]|nr:hypothetical protein [Acetobacteraceae bacterium]
MAKGGGSVELIQLVSGCCGVL